MTFRISGLAPERFTHLVGLDDEQLARHGAVRLRATAADPLPDRIGLRDARAGESVLLINHEHHAVETPFRSSHAIFVLEQAREQGVFIDEMPPSLRERLLSIRAFDGAGMMVDADVVEGRDAESLISQLLSDATVAYLHAHYARPGCFAAHIERHA